MISRAALARPSPGARHSCMALDHLVLGLVAAGVGHGYAIARRIEMTLGERGTVQRSHVYAALARLEQRGFVTVHAAQPPGMRWRRTFVATDGGRRSLAAWLERAPDDGASVLRRTLLGKVALRALLGELPSRREVEAERAARRRDPGGGADDLPSSANSGGDEVSALLRARMRRHRDVELWLLDRLDAQRAAGPLDAAARAPLTRSRTGSASR
jgi:DNA-binding PadR family transcriptional regulator